MILVWHFRHKNVWAKHFIPTPPSFPFKNKNNQKVRLESINDIKKHFQNNDQETLVSNIIYTIKNYNYVTRAGKY